MERELALGLCFSDGRINSFDDVKTIEQPDDSAVRIMTGDSRESSHNEIKIIRSSSGIIKELNEAIPCVTAEDDMSGIHFSARLLAGLQDDFYSRQKIFVETGATHAAAVYDINGKLVAFAEDVGRHNALDKCIGTLLVERRMKEAVFCMLSSRLSYEMVMKADRAGFPVVAGASAPTGYAVTLARQMGITLAGFLRKGRFNLYSGEWRVDMD